MQIDLKVIEGPLQVSTVALHHEEIVAVCVDSKPGAGPTRQHGDGAALLAGSAAGRAADRPLQPVVRRLMHERNANVWPMEYPVPCRS